MRAQTADEGFDMKIVVVGGSGVLGAKLVATLSAGGHEVVAASRRSGVDAVTGEGLDELRARIADRFADRYEDVRLLLPYEDGGKLAELYALGAPIHEREDLEHGVLIRARLPQREVRRFARFLVADAHEGSAHEGSAAERG